MYSHLSVHIGAQTTKHATTRLGYILGTLLLREVKALFSRRRQHGHGAPKVERRVGRHEAEESDGLVREERRVADAAG